MAPIPALPVCVYLFRISADSIGWVDGVRLPEGNWPLQYPGVIYFFKLTPAVISARWVTRQVALRRV